MIANVTKLSPLPPPPPEDRLVYPSSLGALWIPPVERRELRSEGEKEVSEEKPQEAASDGRKN